MNPMLALMTAQMQMMTAAMMAMAEANAAMAALFSRQSNVNVGDITVYFPFGQGYSQDIDPNTNWVLARSAGLAPGSPEAIELAQEFGRQQELIAELTEAPEAEAAASPKPDTLARLKTSKQRIDSLSRARR
ncbi:MAG: hypothetical protein AAGI70_01250 [Pseudomonadota bacterium]